MWSASFRCYDLYDSVKPCESGLLHERPLRSPDYAFAEGMRFLVAAVLFNSPRRRHSQISFDIAKEGEGRLFTYIGAPQPDCLAEAISEWVTARETLEDTLDFEQE